MPRKRTRREGVSRVFMITGVPQEERIVLGKHIENLGGEYKHNDHFHSACTHLVCGHLRRSEKFLGALTQGRWVVRPEYVLASAQSGRWLDEVEYEWSSLEEGHDQILATAAKRNRWRASNSTERLFQDWQASVVLGNAKHQAVYRRLLVCGGAKVTDIKLPAKTPYKYSECLSYLFLDNATALLTENLRELGVMCLNANFISDCIVMHPMPDPFDYVLLGDSDNCDNPSVQAHADVSQESITVGCTPRKKAGESGLPSTSSSATFLGNDDDDYLLLSQCPPTQKGVSSKMHAAGRSGSGSNDDDGVLSSTSSSSKANASSTSDAAADGAGVSESPCHTKFYVASEILAPEESVGAASVASGRSAVAASSTSDSVSKQLATSTNKELAGSSSESGRISLPSSQSISSSLPSSRQSKSATSVRKDHEERIDERLTSQSIQPSQGDKSKRRDSSDDCVIVTVSDHKQELERLSEGIKNPPKHSLPATATPRKAKVQRSLRDWFSATGKENSSTPKTSEKGKQVIGGLGPSSGSQQKTATVAKPNTCSSVGSENGNAGKTFVQAECVAVPSTSTSEQSVFDITLLLKPNRPPQKSDTFQTPGKISSQIPTRAQSAKLPGSKSGSRSTLVTLTVVKDGQKPVEQTQVSGVACTKVSGTDSTKKKLDFDKPWDVSKESGKFVHGNNARVEKKNTSSSLAATVVSEYSRTTSVTLPARFGSEDKAHSGTVNILQANRPSIGQLTSPNKTAKTQSRVLSGNISNETNISHGRSASSAPSKAKSRRSEPTGIDGPAKANVSKGISNKGRSSARRKTTTERMSDYLEQRKRKSTDQEPEQEQPEQSPEKSSSPQPPPPPKRSRTARGLAGRLAEQLNSASATEIEQRVEEQMKMAAEEIRKKALGGQEENSAASTSASGDGSSNAAATVSSGSIVVPSDANPVSRCANVGEPPAAAASSVRPVTSTPRKRKSDGKTLNEDNYKQTLKPVRPLWCLSTVSMPDQFDFASCSRSDAEALDRCMPVADTMGMIILTSVEEKDYQVAVNTAQSVSRSLPSVEAFRSTVVVVKECSNMLYVELAYSILMAWLNKFPPVTSALRNVYEQALGLDDWEAIRKIIEDAIKSAEDCEMQPEVMDSRPLLLLRLVVAVLQRNFLYYAQSPGKKCNCLVIRCLWSPSYHIYPNARTRQLMEFLESALKHRTAPNACWEELLDFVAMAGQCCHLADNGYQWRSDTQGERSCKAFAQELAPVLIVGAGGDTGRLQELLGLLSPPWLVSQVCAVLLGDFDDYLVPGGMVEGPVTLKKIISKFFFLLPKLSAQTGSEGATPRKKMKKASEDENCPPPHVLNTELANDKTNKMNPKGLEAPADEIYPPPAAPVVNTKLTFDKINKKNPKGETMLHRACIKNDLPLLKQILSVPGVDVNVKDNAGWTPLHEACNHGSAECVAELLKFAPSSTLPSSTLGSSVLPGSALLEAKTCLGNTALDLAETEEMRQILTRENADVSVSEVADTFQEPVGSHSNTAPTPLQYAEMLDGASGQHVPASHEDAQTLPTRTGSTSSTPRKIMKTVPTDENCAPVVNTKLTFNKISKRNPKGETMLHRACIKNDLPLLKQILSVPGVDVNIQDYAGWTPLHEACNHGSVECVKELLKFVPSATLDNFFCPGSRNKSRRVDIHASNNEGITPLHESVIFNQINVVKLLMKYGGSALLEAKTCSGFTPLEMAGTEEMRQILTRENADISFSQDSFTQEPGTSGNHGDAAPTPFLYTEVLDGASGQHLQASYEDAHRFLTLLSLLLRSHLKISKRETGERVAQGDTTSQRDTSSRGDTISQGDTNLRGDTVSQGDTVSHDKHGGGREQQQRGQTSSSEKEGEDVIFYGHCLKRHIRKITSEDVFGRLAFQLNVVETLLGQIR